MRFVGQFHISPVVEILNKEQLHHSQKLELYIGTHNLGTFLCLSTSGLQTQWKNTFWNNSFEAFSIVGFLLYYSGLPRIIFLYTSLGSSIHPPILVLLLFSELKFPWWRLDALNLGSNIYGSTRVIPSKIFFWLK